MTNKFIKTATKTQFNEAKNEKQVKKYMGSFGLRMYTVLQAKSLVNLLRFILVKP